MQGVVPQADDGLIVARGEIGGKDSVILAIEGQFQGGGIGEVSGAKIAAALDLALEDAKKGHPGQVVLLLETGGVRLQEANLGLEAIAEINSSLIAMRQHVPVVGVIAGMVGCFGGMSISASLCSYLIMTRQARLGLNGPEVIEEQSGIEEFDLKDRQLIWGVNGGEQRHATGFADYLAEDDVEAIKRCIVEALAAGFRPRIAPNKWMTISSASPLSMFPISWRAVRCASFGRKDKTYERKDYQHAWPDLV